MHDILLHLDIVRNLGLARGHTRRQSRQGGAADVEKEVGCIYSCPFGAQQLTLNGRDNVESELGSSGEQDVARQADWGALLV